MVRADNSDDEDENEAYSIGLWGDTPYSDLQALMMVRRAKTKNRPIRGHSRLRSMECNVRHGECARLHDFHSVPLKSALECFDD